MTRECKWCGGSFCAIGSNRHRQKFCSRACGNSFHDAERVVRERALRKALKITCQQCGAGFERSSHPKSRAKYCSLDCARLAKNKRNRKTEIMRNCGNCGAEYEAVASNQKFCCNTCNVKHRLSVDKVRLYERNREWSRRRASDRSLSLLLLPMSSLGEV